MQISGGERPKCHIRFYAGPMLSMDKSLHKEISTRCKKIAGALETNLFVRSPFIMLAPKEIASLLSLQELHRTITTAVVRAVMERARSKMVIQRMSFTGATKGRIGVCSPQGCDNMSRPVVASAHLSAVPDAGYRLLPRGCYSDISIARILPGVEQQKIMRQDHHPFVISGLHCVFASI